MEQNRIILPAALPQHDDFGLDGMRARVAARDSLFLQAEVAIADWPEPVIARVRNLSPGGMLAESAHRVLEGTVMQLSLPNIGAVAARCVWSGEGRFGVAFDHDIEPQAVRRRSAANQDCRQPC